MENVRDYYDKTLKQYIDDEYFEYFDKLIDTYELICKDAVNCGEDAKRETEHFNIVQRLDESPFRGNEANDKNHREFTLCMDKLSNTWDGIAKERKTIQRKNVFFLTYYNDEIALEEDCYTAKLFNRYTLPYKRLVSLSIRKDEKKPDYRPILHEMGHYIGFRKRKDERKELLEELVCYSVLGRIYQICLNQYDRVSYDEKPRLFFDLYSSLGELRKRYCEELFINLHKIYIKLKENVIEPADKMVKENNILYFAKEYVNVVLPQIDSCLQSELSERRVSKEVKSKADQNIEKAIVYLVKEHEKENYTEINMVLNCIEEPTADCFMIAMCDMNLIAYLQLILDNAYDFWSISYKGNDSPEDFCRFMAAPDHRIRIIAVCQALLKDESFSFSSVFENESIDNKYQWNEIKLRCIKKACVMLDAVYKKSVAARWKQENNINIFRNCENKKELLEFSQGILNPQEQISNYIKKIVDEYRTQLGIVCYTKENGIAQNETDEKVIVACDNLGDQKLLRVNNPQRTADEELITKQFKTDIKDIKKDLKRFL